MSFTSRQTSYFPSSSLLCSGLLALSLIGLASPAVADEPFFQWNAFGTANVHRNNVYKTIQDFSPTKRWSTDLERLEFEGEFEFSPKLELETEIEFEHGGTGSSLEYAPLEEFGEFESETEQGGEVRLEKFDLTYKAKNWFNLHGGYIGVPIGWTTYRERPTEYYTVERNRAEINVIPTAWREFGVGFFGDLGEFNYEYSIVSGLNSEFFRKYNWIAKSSSRRFETSFADSWAHTLRLDYGFARDHRVIGASFYYGDSAANRQKEGKLTESADVMIVDVHALYTLGGLNVRALYLRGFLQNAHLVGTANASLPGLANPGGYSSVGKEAEAAFVEAGYNLVELFPTVFENEFDVFARYDHWDTMKAAPQNGVRDPRFRETTWTFGINSYVVPEVVLKAQYANVKNGLDAVPTDHQIALGIGFSYVPSKGNGAEK